MAVDDSDEDHFTTSEDGQSLTSATRAVLDMSSDQTLADPTQMSNSHLASEQSSATVHAKSAPEDDTVVDSAQDANPQKKLKSRVNMKKEVDLTLPPLFGTHLGDWQWVALRAIANPIQNPSISKLPLVNGRQKLPPPPESGKVQKKSKSKEHQRKSRSKAKSPPPPPKANIDSQIQSQGDLQTRWFTPLESCYDVLGHRGLSSCMGHNLRMFREQRERS
jgi:hypothetical protein